MTSEAAMEAGMTPVAPSAGTGGSRGSDLASGRHHQGLPHRTAPVPKRSTPPSGLGVASRRD